MEAEQPKTQPEEDKKQTLSKAQKKKLKDKAKAAEKKDEGTAPGEENKAAGEDTKPDEKESKDKAKKGKKGAAGGRSAIAKLAQEKIKAKQEEEEIRRKEEEEIRKKEEEEERIRKEEEEEKKKQEELKRKLKKDKIDQLKKEGKYMTKAQKAKQAEVQRIRQQMIEQGLIQADAEDENEGDEKKQKTMVVRNKKKDKKKLQAQETADHEKDEPKEDGDAEQEKVIEEIKEVKHEKKQAAVVDTNKQEEEDEDVVEDWENADIDDIASKIVSKDLKQTVTHGKAVRVDDEEDKDDDAMTKAKTTKDEKKIKQAVKASKEEEKQGGGDVFAKAMESQSSATSRKARIEELKAKQEARKQEQLQRALDKKKGGKDQVKLRCPIICILGHVDTGKTLILDKLRRTNVQAGEAGGITQQIGATYFPPEALQEHLERMRGRIDLDLQIPGYLIIDTPGHESFTNLRSRGSSLCDIAILVVDIMHGLEKQTLESLQLLKQKKAPFIVALNKIDRMYEWKSTQYNNVRDSIDMQAHGAKHEFKERLNKTILAFAEEGINACPYWENTNPEEFVSLVPTSAITGEGLPDLMIYISEMCQTFHKAKLQEKQEFECTVLEVKVIEGHGTTIDVILVNGVLNVGDTIVLAGFNGPIATTIRALLTPQPLKEMRVKGEYIHHKSIKGSMGIKISAPGLEHAMAGSELYKAENEEEVENYKAQIADDLVDIMNKYVDKTNQGVCVQASTLGSLEALLEFLKQMKIPVTSINIGPVHKKDILKAMKSLTGEGHMKEYATILAFDVKIEKEAEQFAEDNDIKIFTANIIYHLFDQFTEYVKKCKEERKSEEGTKAVFPALLEIVKGAMFHAKDPIIIGVTVKAGILKIGTPLCIPEKEKLRIGNVESIELNGKPLQAARAKDGGVAVKISGESQVMFGRHFDDSNQIVSYITRDSIDALKQFFKDDLNKDDWKLVIQLKKMFGIP